MAKSFVTISLATKLRLLFAAAVLGIIAAALALPWYFMELLAEQNVRRTGQELTHLRLAEWTLEHQSNPEAAGDDGSHVTALYSGTGADQFKGPYFIRLSTDLEPDRPLDPTASSALSQFARIPGRDLTVIRSVDDQDRKVFRCFRAVRATQSCTQCHDNSRIPQLQFQPGQLVAMIDVAMPASTGANEIVWWTRGAFLGGVIMAAVLALALIGVITQKIILKPIRSLRRLADHVIEGDFAARSNLRTDDEFQRLGESFNEMLEAITDQHEKLRAANRALDLKLHEISEANVTLFQANKVKDDFLANVSHELRTPLNSIIGFADLLGGSQDERVRRYGKNIGSAAGNLLNMINDLLDLAKIEAGKAQIRLDKVSVIDTCQTLTALMAPQANKKQLVIRSELSNEIPIIESDAGKLQQILYNLLSNAIKFTPIGGQVTVSAGINHGQRSNGQEVFISVSDTGPGIAEADHGHIFEKFFQLDSGLTKSTYGAGLGLAISKELASLLGGRLTLKSSPGKGATFTLFLPAGDQPDN